MKIIKEYCMKYVFFWIAADLYMLLKVSQCCNSGVGEQLLKFEHCTIFWNIPWTFIFFVHWTLFVVIQWALNHHHRHCHYFFFFIWFLYHYSYYILCLFILLYLQVGMVLSQYFHLLKVIVAPKGADGCEKGTTCPE